MENQNKSIFISAGEISGDIHAADLINKLKSKNPNLNIYGIGGQYMAKTNYNSIDNDTSYLSTVGFLESLRFYITKYKLLKKTIKFIKNNKINLVILVDNQGFNIPLAKAVNKMNIKTIYYFPPHVSIWGKWNSELLSKICNLLIVPFYDDYEIYKLYSNNVIYSGNPLVDKIKNFKFDENFYNKYNINKNKKIISLFPGSRFQEIENLLPTMIDAAKILAKNYDFQYILSVSHPIYKNLITNIIKKKNFLNLIKIIDNEQYSCMHISNVILGCSGTAILEAALIKKPAIVCYKVTNLTYLIGKFLVKKKYISLPNIILDKEIYPELIQKKFNVNNIIDYTLKFINMNNDMKKEYDNYYTIIENKTWIPNSLNIITDKIFELLG